jgi:glycosyltransferase involved in cell wall biosynthesis
LPEVVEHGVTGFLHDPENVPGQVQSVLKLLTNESLRRTMGRRARREARKRFSTEEMVGRYVQVYESLDG